VTVLKVPTPVATGVILVEVPADLVQAEAGFSFALPRELAELANATRSVPQVTLADGSPLPTWLRYRASDKRFVATKVPSGALPLQAKVKIGTTITMVMIRVKGQ
jgi:hypothetical protein